jgi:hypothetical protein
MTKAQQTISLALLVSSVGVSISDMRVQLLCWRKEEDDDSQRGNWGDAMWKEREMALKRLGLMLTC